MLESSKKRYNNTNYKYKSTELNMQIPFIQLLIKYGVFYFNLIFKVLKNLNFIGATNIVDEKELVYLPYGRSKYCASL